MGRIAKINAASRKKASGLKMKRITAKQLKARKINILKAQEAARRKRNRKSQKQVKQNTARIALRSLFK